MAIVAVLMPTAALTTCRGNMLAAHRHCLLDRPIEAMNFHSNRLKNGKARRQ
jgi:hypothetical protein